MSALRSLLFVPGSRPDRFDKALAAGADCVCIDLEDAVLPDDKSGARRDVTEWLAEQAPATLVRTCVRSNPPRTPLGRDDLAALAEASQRPGRVMLPKVSSVEDVSSAMEVLPGVSFIALIESPAGILDAASIARAPGLDALMFGGADFSAETGCEMCWEPLLAARGQLVLAAHAAGLQLIDVPYLDVADSEGLAAETAAVRALGFTAKAAIHPAQVATINDAFTPGEGQADWARRVLEVVGDDDNGAGLVDGKFVDRPIILRARRILAATVGS